LFSVNERSMRGDRDSELASVIRDTDMIDSRMAGKPFQVGRFAHTLRMRLMRGSSPLRFSLESRAALIVLRRSLILQNISVSTSMRWKRTIYSLVMLSSPRTTSRFGKLQLHTIFPAGRLLTPCFRIFAGIPTPNSKLKERPTPRTTSLSPPAEWDR
jgi:hypothetical protein